MSCREAAGVPAGSPRISVAGEQIAVCREGRGVPVVCLTAIAHGGGDFDAFAARMKSRFEIIRIDWPGHGRSGDAAAAPSARRYADLLAELLPALAVEHPILIGNSIGGAAAILHAERHPVRGLVICNAGGLVAVDATVKRFCSIFAGFFAAGERRAGWFGPAFAAYYRLLVLPSRSAAAQRRRIIASGYEVAGQLRLAWESFGRAEADIRDVAGRLDAPVWVAWSRGDRIIPLGRCRPAIKAMKRAVLTTFAGGHAPFLEQPDAFAEAFVDFTDALRAA
ncbi:MAG TPA: alpha/beta hydrolase [Caulobacter sp.]|nr:alpha/beta hydrolase [Caulobacter sp.]